MISGVVPYAPYCHNFEASPFYTHDVVTTCPYHSALSHPLPHPDVPVPLALSEVVEEANQTKLHQQIRKLMAVRVLGFADVGAEVP